MIDRRIVGVPVTDLAGKRPELAGVFLPSSSHLVEKKVAGSFTGVRDVPLHPEALLESLHLLKQLHAQR